MQMTMAESSKRACRFPGCSRRGLAQFLQTRTLIDDAIGRRIGCDSALKAGVDVYLMSPYDALRRLGDLLASALGCCNADCARPPAQAMRLTQLWKELNQPRNDLAELPAFDSKASIQRARYVAQCNESMIVGRDPAGPRVRWVCAPIALATSRFRRLKKPIASLNGVQRPVGQRLREVATIRSCARRLGSHPRRS